MSAELIQPPHSEQAERAVLSAIIAGIAFDDLQLDPDDFYLLKHRIVYEAATKLAQSREAVDIVTIADQIEAAGRSAEIGGMAGLGEFTDPVRNIQAYANIVRDNAQARKLVKLGMHLISANAKNWREYNDEVVSTLLAQTHTTKNWDCDLTAALRDGVDAIERAFRADGLVGINTGFERLNHIFGGYHDSDLYVFGARPSMGKSAYLLNSACAAGVPVAIVSGEMPRGQLALRMISAIGGIDSMRLRNADLEDADWPKITRATAELQQRNMQILDKPAPTISEVTNFARRAKRDHGARIVFVDYIQRLKSSDRKQPKHEQVSDVVMGLKELARELHVPVVALAQVNRDVEKRVNKRPSMGDLKDSGAIEQEADAVVLIYRDEVYNADTPDAGVAEFIVDKNRHGRIGMTKLAWDGAHMRFRDLANGW